MKRPAIAVTLVALLAGVGQALLAPAPAAAQETADFYFDVVVYGGTSGGVIAAYTAKQKGHSVLLVEPGRHLGGMTSGGLGKTDFGDKNALTGLSRDFYRRVGAYYGRERLALRFEPHVAEDVFEFYVDTAGVEVLFSRQVTAVEKEESELQTITLEYAGGAHAGSDLVVGADIFIDTSYEGDLMSRAGVSYIVGRESNEKYNERFNGVQLSRRASSTAGREVETTPEFPLGVDPYVVPGDSLSGLLPLIQGIGLEPTGTGDDKVQAYNFRMCLRQGEDRIPISKPTGYDPGRYELLVRQMKVDPWESLYDGFIVSEIPNGKTDWNNYGLIGVSTDYIGASWDYPEAGYDRRGKIWQDHVSYQKGLLWFLATDHRVPEPIREEMQTWGYCPDEFLDTGGWPHALYIRGARRMVGEYVMTEHDILGEHVEDGMALGSYGLDSHNAQRVVVNGMVRNEGNIFIGGFEPYPISYRSITPKREEATNLLVPVALSASHVAHGSIRMEPVFMILGQSAGVAASLALERDKPVQAVDVEALREELYENPMADGTAPPSDAYRLEL